ncbi:MAG: SLC13 family permease [Thermodesulfobacteriota bacterium]
MRVEIDRRPLWVIIALKARRPILFLLLGLGFFAFLLLPAPEGLGVGGMRAIAVFLLCLVLWVSNAVPVAITGLFAIVLVPLLGILPRESTYSLFGNEAVFFILGAFILSGAVMQSGLSNRVALRLMEKYGGSPKRLVISIFLLAASLSFVMSEHAVAAMLFPIVLEISKSLKLRPGKSNYGKLLFFALAWGSVIGGVGTFLGGARVPLAMGILKETTGESFSFIGYTVAVAPLVVVLLIVGYIVLTRFFPIDIKGVESAREVIVKRAGALGKVRPREYAVGFILVITIFFWVTLGKTVGLAAVAMLSVTALFVLKLVKWRDIEEYVNWGIILMYGGAIILGTALDRSGAAKWMVDFIMAQWAETPITVFALFSLLAILLTESMSNAAVIAVLLPVSIGMAGRMNMSPEVLTYAVAIPAGLAFMLPMSTPANAIAVSSDYISVRDMVKGGVIMFITSWVTFNVMAHFYWPLIGLT